MQKPTNASGTRDFGPEIMRKRDFLLDSIRSIFKKYGFEPLETPALENLSMLTGKYGEEGDKLLYKIRSNKEIVNEVPSDKAEAIKSIFPDRWVPGKSKLGLRYDLTVPFARFVVQHRNELTFPFRRFQIQPVWRADRPQKGRFREFTQCDADCIGSSSLLHEADLIRIYNEAFMAIGLPNAILKINHRKFLEALVDELQLDFPVAKFTSTLDKLDKIGTEGVERELVAMGVDSTKCTQLFDIIDNAELTRDNLAKFALGFNNNVIAQVAIDELGELLDFLDDASLQIRVELDLSLARGLDYYTGCIFEAVVPDSGIGSVSGGGRYDNLTGVFGLNDVSGVGISFGIDRIYEILEAESKWPDDLERSNSLLLCHFDKKGLLYANTVASKLRDSGISVVVYPEVKKLKKQLDFANKTGSQYAVVIGDEEMQTSMLAVKNLLKGDQEKLTLDELIMKMKDEAV